MKKCPKCNKRRKHLAYGQKRKSFWCYGCDAGHEDSISKKGERQKAKKEIRKEVRLRLGKLSLVQKDALSRKIQESLYNLSEFRESKCILVYLSTDNEVDTFQIVKRCFLMKKRVVIPKVDKEPSMSPRVM